jgi:cytoskeletal protein CcmA (bactofilin family)
MFGKKVEESDSWFSKALSGLEHKPAGDAAHAPGASLPSSGTRVAQRSIPVELSEQVESFIGRNSKLEGELRSEQSLRIQGSVRGEVDSRRVVFLDEAARITGRVSGATVFVAGTVDGEIHCPGRLEIRSTGRVTGEINAGTLIMHEGAVVNGQVRMLREQPHPASAPSQAPARVTEERTLSSSETPEPAPQATT